MVPAFSVFQTPPEPTATYQTLSLSGCTATSAIRPDKNAGPTLRILNAPKGSFFISILAFFFLRRWACVCVKPKLKNSKVVKVILRNMYFISIVFGFKPKFSNIYQ